MKELQEKIETPIAIQKQVLKEKKLLGSIRLHKGQQCYELNLDTGLIRIADVKQFVHLDKSVSRSLVINENCMYETAINIDNSRRKFVARLKKINDKYRANA